MATWSDLKVRALLAIWSDSRIQEELDGAVRNKQVYEKIANKLEKQGIGNSAILKLKTLKQATKKSKTTTTMEENSANFTKSLTAFLGIGQLPHPSLS